MVGATGFQPATTCTPIGRPSDPTVHTDSQASTTLDRSTRGPAVPRNCAVCRDFAANLLPPAPEPIEAAYEVRAGSASQKPEALSPIRVQDALLSVATVARQLGVC